MGSPSRSFVLGFTPLQINRRKKGEGGTQDEDAPGDDELSQLLNEIHGWWREQLSAEDLEFTRSFVPTLDLEIDGFDALCFHGSPRSYDDWIFATTPDDELAGMLDAQRPSLLIGGHIVAGMFHIQQKQFFDITEPAQREPVAVKF